jgi:carbamoyltransferase
MTAILGLNAFHGDAAAALVIDGELVAAAEEERFSRIKHVAGFPTQAAAWCLAEAGLDANRLDHVAVSRDPGANTGRELWRTIRHGASARYLKERLDNAAKPRDVRAPLGLTRPDVPVHAVEHHQAHVASAFLVSPFDEAAILSMDGFGDFASTMTASGRGNEYTVLDRVLFPHSLGMFYAALTQWLGFPEYGDEGKVMGLAPYGDPTRHIRRMREIVQPHGDLFVLDLNYFTHDEEGVDMTWDSGAPRIERIYSTKVVETFGEPRAEGGELTQHHRDVAAALQLRLEEICVHLAERLRQRTGLSDLCLVGGVALNAVANARVAAQSGFDRVYVPPAAGDAGSAIGAAFHVWNTELGEPRGFVMRDPYTGPQYDDASYEAAISAAGLSAERIDDDELFATVAGRIVAGDVVGWFQGRMEFGPRALGHRSIVADPRRADMRAVLNDRIKRREPFRPFGLSILAEAEGEWFERNEASPFMELVHQIRQDRREAIPAVDHVDHTGRVQSVEREIEPRYYRLIEAFGAETGVPMLLNTSFNENEPIVMSPEHAVDTFVSTRMDLLVLGNYVVRRATDS